MFSRIHKMISSTGLLGTNYTLNHNLRRERKKEKEAIKLMEEPVSREEDKKKTGLFPRKEEKKRFESL